MYPIVFNVVIKEYSHFHFASIQIVDEHYFKK